ncbi:MAG: hypothetical protein MNPFHGCM_02037 [Gemmatimonadaceae bacterium]|nr:hypothetical protein [Gemmatimonadaceae bacterium]
MIAKPRLVFRVGITGHRPNRLEKAEADLPLLHNRVKSVLQLVSETVHRVHREDMAPYAAEAPVLRLVSSLAEGADRIAAREALRLGFELDVPLPFARDRYELDFVSANSSPPRDTRAEFRELLGHARRVLELDSVPESDTAYVAVGTTTVRQCDILLAIWDGEPSHGPGGTPDSVVEALRIELPTVWIDAHGATRHATGLAELEDSGIVRRSWDAESIANRVRLIVALPTADEAGRTPAGHGEHTAPVRAARDYFAENPSLRAPNSFFTTANRFFARGWQYEDNYRQLLAQSDMLAPMRGEQRRRPEPESGQLSRELVDDVPASEWTPQFDALVQALSSVIAPSFRDADLLAIRYANLHRDYMALGFLLYAPLAVLCAFLSFATRHSTAFSILFGLAEVVLIGAIWGGHRRNVRHRYHERWLDYRSIAEKLRHVLLLAPLGRPTLDVQFPITLGVSDPTSHWTSWYIRARVREEGLVAGRLTDPAQRAALRTLLWRWFVRGQIRYHARTAARMRTALRHVHAYRDRMFVVAALAALSHVAISAAALAHPIVHDWELRHVWLVTGLSTLTVFLPAVVAALHGYANQADFENSAIRSEGELQRLTQLDTEIRAEPDPSGIDLLRATSLTSESMLAELAEWRQDTASRPAEKP